MSGPLGRVVATERKPNTPHEFHFWTSLDSPVGIGTIVRVDGAHPIDGQIPHIYGIVVEGFSYTDLQSPMHDVLGHDGSPANAGFSVTERTEIRLYTAAVLRQIPEEPLQPVPMGEVFLAGEEDVASALRMDAYLKDGAHTGIPIGVYRAGATDSVIWLDADFLLGPEAAHLNISGMSGLATKTSAVEWLLSSVFTHFPESKGSIAAVCFNVKGPDLCYLDQPAIRLEESDRALYEKMKVEPKPFSKVEYFAPYNAKGYSLNTLRSNEALTHNVTPLTWGLREVLQYAEVLLNKDDLDAKADALIDFIGERVVGCRMERDGPLSKDHSVESFADLEAWFRDLLQGMEAKNQDSWRTHHIATIRKVRNRLINISTRCAGLVTNSGDVSDLPFGSFEDRAVYVVDVASLEEDAQDLIFARIVSRLREHLERRDLGVKHLIVFVDELNKYAPADGPETYVRKMLLDLSERGRYLGLVLFSAQQFRSQVQRRVVGNAGTGIYGRMDVDELATPGYATISPATKIKLATLPKGELMLRHPHFTQPIFVKFPRPAVLNSREGIERFPPAPELPFADAVVRQMRQLDRRVSADALRELMAGRRDEDVRRALAATRRERPQDAFAFFAACLGRRVNGEVVSARRGIPALKHADEPYG